MFSCQQNVDYFQVLVDNLFDVHMQYDELILNQFLDHFYLELSKVNQNVIKVQLVIEYLLQLNVLDYIDHMQD
jgi:hypothetical protein